MVCKCDGIARGICSAVLGNLECDVDMDELVSDGSHLQCDGVESSLQRL